MEKPWGWTGEERVRGVRRRERRRVVESMVGGRCQGGAWWSGMDLRRMPESVLGGTQLKK